MLYFYLVEFVLLIEVCMLTGAAALAPPPDLMVASYYDRSSKSSTNGMSRLLTQRAVQQTMFYQGVQNDEVMARWLGEFMQNEPEACLSPDFHGVDALPSPSSAAYICGLLCLPPTLISVRRPARRPPGGSRNNPYTQDSAFDDIAVEVPCKFLAESIMKMRTTVAQEWSQDLTLFVSENQALRSRHASAMRAGVAGSAANADAAKLNFANSIPSFEVGRLGSGGRRSSPFRLASYDLLKLLATRFAMDRVLVENSKLLSNKSSRQWLLRFWDERSSEFHGHSTWTQGEGEPGAADSLLLALFNAEPSIMTTDSGEVVLVDPGGLAETLLVARNDIAKEWADALELVEDEHQCWQGWKVS